MNLRNNKGYMITDVSISIIILLIFVPVIMGLVYNIEITKRSTEVRSEAINIAVNTVEAAKGIALEELNATKVLSYLEENNLYDFSEENYEDTVTIKTDIASYELIVSVTDYANTEGAPSGVTENKVKTVDVTVNYRINGKDKEINLSTVVK